MRFCIAKHGFKMRTKLNWVYRKIWVYFLKSETKITYIKYKLLWLTSWSEYTLFISDSTLHVNKYVDEVRWMKKQTNKQTKSWMTTWATLDEDDDLTDLGVTMVCVHDSHLFLFL